MEYRESTKQGQSRKPCEIALRGSLLNELLRSPLLVGWGKSVGSLGGRPRLHFRPLLADRPVDFIENEK